MTNDKLTALDQKTEIAMRLRRVCTALNLNNAVPDDNVDLYNCMFSVLGIVARKLETQKPNINEMVNKFLGWNIPSDFYPDCGISFDRESGFGFRPIGTNLFTAVQAKEMFEYCLSYESTNEQAEQSVQGDWVTVPRILTEKMLAAAIPEIRKYESVQAVYTAVLSASPQVKQSANVEGEAIGRIQHSLDPESGPSAYWVIGKVLEDGAELFTHPPVQNSNLDELVDALSHDAARLIFYEWEDTKETIFGLWKRLFDQALANYQSSIEKKI